MTDVVGRPSFLSRYRGAFPGIVALGFLCGNLAACDPSEGPRMTASVPSDEDFSAVSRVLELRCGSLDCHGAPARNFRIYGHFGLRHNGSDVPGGRATTEEEVMETYASIILLQPEVLHRVFTGDAALNEWIVFAKGQGLYEHQGGPALPPGGDAELCLVSWARGDVDVEACAGDSFGPLPRPGEDW